MEKWYAIVCRTRLNGSAEHMRPSVLSQLSTHQPTGVNSNFFLVVPQLEAQCSEKFPSVLIFFLQWVYFLVHYIKVNLSENELQKNPRSRKSN